MIRCRRMRLVLLPRAALVRAMCFERRRRAAGLRRRQQGSAPVTPRSPARRFRAAAAVTAVRRRAARRRAAAARSASEGGCRRGRRPGEPLLDLGVPDFGGGACAAAARPLARLGGDPLRAIGLNCPGELAVTGGFDGDASGLKVIDR